MNDQSSTRIKRILDNGSRKKSRAAFGFLLGALVLTAVFVIAFRPDRGGDDHLNIGNYEVACPVRSGDVITYPDTDNYKVRVTTNTGEYCILSIKTGISTSTPGYMTGRREIRNGFILETFTTSTVANAE